MTLGQRKQPIMSRALVKTLRNAEQAKATGKKEKKKSKANEEKCMTLCCGGSREGLIVVGAIPVSGET